jgi:ATP-dependent Zn protease
MDSKKKNQKLQKPGLFNQIFIALFIFISITLIYSLVTRPPTTIKPLGISDVAKGMTSGTIEHMEVSGDNITVYFKDKTEGAARKEADSSLSETLKNYGVTSEQLASTPIAIKSESGFSYWLVNVILPLLIPGLVILFFIWMLSY